MQYQESRHRGRKPGQGISIESWNKKWSWNDTLVTMISYASAYFTDLILSEVAMKLPTRLLYHEHRIGWNSTPLPSIFQRIWVASQLVLIRKKQLGNTFKTPIKLLDWNVSWLNRRRTDICQIISSHTM